MCYNPIVLEQMLNEDVNERRLAEYIDICKIRM